MNDITVHLSIPFPTEREADVAYQTLRVDTEPSSSGVTKTLTLKSNQLQVVISGKIAHKVRAGLTFFLDSLILVTETMNEFGPPAPTYDYY